MNAVIKNIKFVYKICETELRSKIRYTLQFHKRHNMIDKYYIYGWETLTKKLFVYLNQTIYFLYLSKCRESPRHCVSVLGLKDQTVCTK